MKNLLKKLAVFFWSGSETNSLDNAQNKNSKKTSRYRPQRTRNIYSNSESKIYRLSRSKLELFSRCQRCFYLDRKLGVGHPPSYPFNLNIAVDELLKKEFDTYRFEQKTHPFFIENNIEAVPFKHDDINKWRDSLHAGIQYTVPGTNIMLYGGIDDIWVNTNTKELIVVDYKATSKKETVSLDADWQSGYKRQAEIYQWLLRKNGFVVSNTAYFVYCNGKASAEKFDKQLQFDVSLLPYVGDDSWVENSIIEAYKCLQSDVIPPISESCDYCQYWEGVRRCLERILS